METYHINCGAGVERLEARRLLCGDGMDTAADHQTAANVAEVSVSDSARDEATSHIAAAFAQGRGIRGGEVVWGETTVINGALLGTWAIVSRKDGTILAAGATVPLALSEDQPQQGGPGPAGAIASLEFPAVAQAATYFNHLELQTQPGGHPASPLAADPTRYLVPHFDFHFYNMPEEQVRAIPPWPPAPLVPDDRLPAGYAQPEHSVPQMGRHAPLLTELAAHGPFSKVMVAGFTPMADRMHFIEPMITTATLLEQKDFALGVPTPQAFDFDSLYPTRFEAVFQGGAHHFIFSDFIDTDPTTPVSAASLVLAQPATPAGLSSESVSTEAPRLAVTILADDEEDGADEVLS